ncbi:DNA-binding transcriptional MocR family regulator [Luteibacter sp. 621]|jgi:DNA-binding transcriptional MocR family regulator|uniref:aminotransferase-like domain-containing protein n=1 Tax=Luteibacter sp. 621 TaxID=3373916 RepID=UPI003D2048F9
MSYDLAVNLPLRAAPVARLREALASFPLDDGLLAYPTPAGGLAVREAIAGWMRRHSGFNAVDPRRLLLTIGARHALVLALEETCAPGDTLLMEELTFHGFRLGVLAHGVRPAAVAVDAEGMRPDALEDAVHRTGARTAYVQPTLHNPTTATMSLRRREAIVELARRLDLTLIEGDVYAALGWQGTDTLPSLAELAPERVLHAGGMGKVLGPGLRIGWLLAPDDGSHHRLTEALQLATDGLAPFLPAIVAGWMADGTADGLLGTLASSMRDRNLLAREILGEGLRTNGGMHAWLPRDDADAVYERARAAGVLVTPPVPFNAEGGVGRGLRICLGAEEGPGRLEQGLATLASVL